MTQLINLHGSPASPIWITPQNLETLRAAVAEDVILWAILLERNINMAHFSHNREDVPTILSNQEIDRMISRGDKIPVYRLPRNFNISEAEGRVAFMEDRSSESHGFGDGVAAEDFKRGWHGARLQRERDDARL